MVSAGSPARSFPPGRRAPLRGRRTRVATLGTALVLALFSPWRVPLTSDGLALLRTGAAIAFEGTFRLPGPPRGGMLDPFYFVAAPTGGGVVALYPPLGPLVRAGAFRLAALLPAGAVRGAGADLLLCLLPIVAMALSVPPIARLVRFGGVGARAAPLLASGLVLGTFLMPLGVSDFQEPLLVLLVAVALERAAASRRLVEGTRARALLASGAALSVALLAKPTAWVLAPALLLLAARPRRGAGLRGPLTLVLGALPGIVLFLASNAVRFGSPWSSGYAVQLAHPLARRVGLAWTLLRLTLLPNRGLLFFAPLVLLAVPGVVRELLRRTPRWPDLVASALAAGGFLGVNALWWAWEGGMGWGPRLLAPAVVALAPLVAAGSRGWPRATALLLVAGFLVNAPGLLLDVGRVYQVAAADPVPGAPLGPVAPIHRLDGGRGALAPYQRPHYVPGSATWLVAGRILARLVTGKDGPLTGALPSGSPPDAAPVRLLLGAQAREGSDAGRFLMEEAIVTSGPDPDRALRMARRAVAFGGPYASTRVVAARLLASQGRHEEARRLLAEASAAGPP